MDPWTIAIIVVCSIGLIFILYPFYRHFFISSGDNYPTYYSTGNMNVGGKPKKHFYRKHNNNKIKK
jgi:hypothetical protein